MKKIEELFNTQKIQLDMIEVPDELEARLRSALAGQNKNYRHQSFYQRYIKQLKIAVILVFALLVGLNYDVIASYGKQLVGYDQVMDVTLKNLNNLGKGQLIEKSHTFANGVCLRVDYVMLDENQLLLFYTVKDPNGDVTNAISPFMSLNSFLGKSHMQSSQGLLNEEETEAKYIASFKPPSLLARKLTLNFALNGQSQGANTPAEISFDLERGKAMGYTLKKNLMQTVKVDETNIKLESLLASPTQVVIKGSAQSIVGLAMDTLSGERFRPIEVNLKLIANGQEVVKKGGGVSTDMKGITFHTNFDALPSPLTDLKLELVSFSADHDVNKQYDLDKKGGKQILDILGQKVEINEVENNNKETFITITSADNLVLTKVYLIADGKKIPLEQTIDDQYDKSSDGQITHQRTLRFVGTGDDLRLYVQRMTYAKDYHKVVNIPLDT
jgi:hypothetical protein